MNAIATGKISSSYMGLRECSRKSVIASLSSFAAGQTKASPKRRTGYLQCPICENEKNVSVACDVTSKDFAVSTEQRQPQRPFQGCLKLVRVTKAFVSRTDLLQSFVGHPAKQQNPRNNTMRPLNCLPCRANISLFSWWPLMVSAISFLLSAV